MQGKCNGSNHVVMIISMFHYNHYHNDYLISNNVSLDMVLRLYFRQKYFLAIMFDTVQFHSNY